MLDPQTLDLLRQIGVDPAAAEAALGVLVWVTVATVIAAIPTAMIARRRGRSVVLWLLLALSIPVLPLLLVWLLPPAARGGDGDAG